MPPHSTPIACKCQHCGTEFLRKPSSVLRDGGKFCSHSCSRSGNKVPLSVRFKSCLGPPNENGCIIWAGTINERGYGKIGSGGRGGRHLYAHRVAWELANGPIPEGMEVMHKCDVTGCVNVEHLILGTHADNMADMIAKARHKPGEGRPQSKLTDRKVIEIRERYAASGISQAELGVIYGVTQGAIKAVVKRRTWKHV